MKIERSRIKEQPLAEELRTGQESLLSGFESLLARAERGLEDAAEELSQRVTTIVERFLRACDQKPKAFRGVAKEWSIWPALDVLEPRLKKKYRHYDPDWIRKRVHLGERTGLKYQGKKGKELGSQIARELFTIIKIQQRQTGPPVPMNFGGVVLARRKAAQFRARCKRLPVLSRNLKVLAQWWRVMINLIDMRYGRSFEDHEVFTKFRTDVKELQKRKAHTLKYAKEYQIRDRILGDIRQGLGVIAR